MSFLSMLQDSQVANALWISTLVAAVSGMLGVFVVLRGQSFAGDVLIDIGASGGAAAFLFGVNAWYGFISFGIAAAVGIDLTGDRARNRDVATGIILTFALGLSALFLYLDSQFSNNANATITILFGSIFAVPPVMVPIIVATAASVVVIVALIYRPLLFSSLQPDIALTRGVNVRLVSLLFILLLAITVENGSLVVGALLSTALLIGPAAAAVQVTKRPGMAILLAMMFGVAASWVGIALAYFSYNWPPQGRGWPVSFFISVIILFTYLMARLVAYGKRGISGGRFLE